MIEMYAEFTNTHMFTLVGTQVALLVWIFVVVCYCTIKDIRERKPILDREVGLEELPRIVKRFDIY